MAKRGKCGRKTLRPKNNPSVRDHHFLSNAARRFMASVPQQEVPAKVSIRPTCKENSKDSEVMGFFLQIQDALGLKLTMVSSKLFLVDCPRKARLPDGSRSNVVTLWHGSSCENGISLLREGFRKGWGGLFGAGIYLGTRDKAIHYSGYRSGYYRLANPLNLAKNNLQTIHEPTQPGMLLKVSAALGQVFLADEAMGNLRAPPPGYNSVHGKKEYTKCWGDGTLNHNEWCVYHPCQVSIQEIHLLG